MDADPDQFNGRSGPQTRSGRLPERYAEPYELTHRTSARAAVVPRNAHPRRRCRLQATIAPSERPAGCHYAGFDLSSEELDKAGLGAYDEMVAGDVIVPVASLRDSFDLIVSFQIMEHVNS